MTLYEILSLVTPILTVIIGGLLGYVFKLIQNNISNIRTDMSEFKREIKEDVKNVQNDLNNVKYDIKSLEKEVYFIKGLIEGNSLSKLNK